MHDLDYAERPASGVDATMCTRCRRVHPNAMFKRVYTPLQARRRGYSNHGDVTYLSSLCHECKPPKRVAPSKMTPRELKNAQGVGRLRAIDVEHELGKRRERYAQKTGARTARRWNKARHLLWQNITTPLSQEIVACKQQAGHMAKRWPDLYDHDFFAVYMEYLLSLRARLKHLKLQREQPEHTRWQAYIPFEEFHDFMDRWGKLVAQLPVGYVSRMRLPGFKDVLDTRAEAPAPKLTLRRADATDRLSQIK